MSQAPKFDKAYWQAKIAEPLWYVEMVELIKLAKQRLDTDSDELAKWLQAVRQFVADNLVRGEVALADHGLNLDAQRQPLDMVVIHHTSAEPGYDLNFMEAVHLLNIYASYFVSPTDEREKSLKGQPLWSNHFRDGRPTFIVYHWLMRMDGTFERLLDDDKIGWQAGNWHINKRSIGICLDNDYEKRDPDPEILQKLAAFIKQNYPNIKKERVIGHCEANPKTICPGSNFLTTWKPLLLEQLAA